MNNDNINKYVGGLKLQHACRMFDIDVVTSWPEFWPMMDDLWYAFTDEELAEMKTRWHVSEAPVSLNMADRVVSDGISPRISENNE